MRPDLQVFPGSQPCRTPHGQLPGTHQHGPCGQLAPRPPIHQASGSSSAESFQNQNLASFTHHFSSSTRHIHGAFLVEQKLLPKMYGELTPRDY